MKLLNINLKNFKSAKVPSYDRAQLKAGIVHIGLGNFHRAHQAWYLHRLMEMGLAHDWAIIGAGVRPYDEDMRKRLAAQDYLTTLIELGPQERKVEVIGSMIGYVPIEEGNAPLIAQMSHPDIRIVSTTVTEGGYYIDPATKEFDPQHPDILHDVKFPHAPRSVFGAIVAALKNRKVAGLQPFACQSCDNLQGNGDIMRMVVVSLARMTDPELANWIDENSSFPSSMVDSIVPATGPKELALAKALGIDDAAPVTHENFRQWVIEDDFCAGRPAWEKVGVTLSNHVHAYEKMKIRILNSGHQVIAAAGDLLGIETISGCMENPSIARVFNKIQHDEILPHVKGVDEYSPEDYVQLIEKRFRNSAIVDTTRRVAFDGSSRQPGFILPSVYECIDKGIAPSGLALVSAIWARYCLGIREDGSQIEANDPNWEALKSRAAQAKSEPKAWLENRNLYGELSDNPHFATPFENWLRMIYTDGLTQTLNHYVEE